MMSCSITYRLSDGKLLEYSKPSGNATAMVDEGLLLLPDSSEVPVSVLESHYASSGILLERPNMSITGGESVSINTVWRIDGIPAGTTMKYPDGTLVVDDGFIEWSSAVAGTFRFRLNCFPYLEREIYATITET